MLLELNEKWLIALNSLSSTPELGKMFWFFADAPILFLPIFLIGMWVYYVIKDKQTQKKQLLNLFFATVLALLINIIIQQLVHFDRPESVLEGVWNLLMSHIPDASFPSDHTAVSIAFVTALFFSWYKKISLIFLPFALIMNISRIISWVHWPFDVIIWTVVWIISGIIICKYLIKNKYFQKFQDILLNIAKTFKL
jgi:undecaprenyl-diphosphatase